MYPKMTCRVESKGGDLYYSKMTDEEAFEKAYKYLDGDDAITN